MRQLMVSTCEELLDLSQRLDWLAPLVVRLFFGYFWLETGWAKLEGLDDFTQRFMEWGVPLPAFSAAVSAWTELLGGGLIMLGLCTRLIAIPMIFNMVIAIALVVIKDVHSFTEFVELDEFVYILLFFWLMLAGPGVVSLDTLLTRALGIDASSPRSMA